MSQIIHQSRGGPAQSVDQQHKMFSLEGWKCENGLGRDRSLFIGSIDWLPDGKGLQAAPQATNRTPPCCRTPCIHRCHHGPCGNSSADREVDSWSPSLACSYNRRHLAPEQWHSYRAAAPRSCLPLRLLNRSSVHPEGPSAPACWCTVSLCGWANVCVRQCARWSAGGKSSRWSPGECAVAERSCAGEAEEGGGCLVEEDVAAGVERWTPL